MLFEVSGHLEYAVSFPSTLLLNIHAQRNASQTVLNERLVVEPRVKIEEFLSEGGENRSVRLVTGRKKHLSVTYEATVECDFELLPARHLDLTPVAELDRKAIPFLYPSRYCQSDRLGRLAWDLFGKIERPYDKVLAIADWIFENVEYTRGSTNSETSAVDTVLERVGVCRDYAHLGITLCRTLNIPARYFTGYAYQLEPPDFHACFEAYVGGRWLIFDATRLSHLNGLVRIATGRDAADAAVACIFGQARFLSMRIDCKLAPGQEFTPLARKRLTHNGVSLDAIGATSRS
jgi:transglutaminase-like putative cysteine protease